MMSEEDGMPSLEGEFLSSDLTVCQLQSVILPSEAGITPIVGCIMC